MGRLGLVALLAMFALVPTAGTVVQAEFELIETIQVPAGVAPPGLRAKTVFDRGKTYKVVVTGTTQWNWPPNASFNLSKDAIYCFAGNCPGGKAPPARFNPGLYFNVPGYASGPLDSLRTPGARQAYRSDHRYEVEFAGANGPFTMYTGTLKDWTLTGGFTVQVYVKGKKCESFVTVIRVTGEFGVLAPGPGQEWEDGKRGQTLCEDEEIHTGPDSEVVIRTPDGAEVTIKELTELRMRGLVKQKDRIKTELMLKMGELKARVKPDEVIRSDFSVQSITATTSVRGTVFTVKHDPGTKVTTVVTSQGSVSVDPKGRGRTVLVKAGKSVDVTRNGVVPVTNARVAARDRARALVIDKVAAAEKPCGYTVPYAANVVHVVPTGTSFRVMVRTTKGLSLWLVAAGKVTPLNAHAKQIDARCG